MKILFNPILPHRNYKNSAKKVITPLKYDTVSFGAMKKSQFDGIDLYIIKKFKARIEKFNSN